MRHPTIRHRSSVTRWRRALAGMLVAGLAVVGAAVGIAAPAAAEEEPVDHSSLEIAVTDCGTYGGQGVVHYRIEDTATAYQDIIVITNAADESVHEVVYAEGTEFEADVALDPGDYTIRYTAVGETNPRFIDTQTFTIGACPDLDVEVTTSCSTGADGTAVVSITGLVEGEDYTFDVVGPDTSVFLSDTFEAAGPAEDVLIVELPPGNYYVYVEWLPGESDLAAPPPPVYDWRGFAVEPCQPEITVEVTECTVPGGTGSAVVKLSNLVAGVEYEVKVADRDAPAGAGYGGTSTVTAGLDGTAQVSVSKLSADRAYTARLDGVWTTGPWEEPPFAGSGSSFTPLESVELVGASDFSLKPCPAATVTTPARLAATGVDGIAALVTGALVLVGLGGAALLITRRRRADSHDVS